MLDTDEESRAEYLRLPEWERTYDRVKADVERRLFRVDKPAGYCLLDAASETGGPRGYGLYGPIGLAGAMKRITYIDNDSPYHLPSSANRRFIRRWLDDPTKRSLGAAEEILGKPAIIEIAAAKLPAVPDDEVEGLCAPVFRFIDRLLANRNATDGLRLTDWLANLVQYPGRMSQVVPVLHGSKECGHRFFAEWVRLKLIGGEHTLTAAEEGSDFLDKVLLHVDTNERLDAMVVEHVARMTLTDRCGRTVQSRLNVICTTTSGVTAAGAQCLFRCSDAVCDPEFEPYLDSARVQRAFYQALLAHKIDHYHVGCFSDFVAEFRSPRATYTENMRLAAGPRGAERHLPAPRM